MNYLIIMPRLTQIFEQSYTFPLGIAYISSSLKSTGRNVIPYNLNYKKGNILDIIENIILQNDIDVIATGGLTAQYWQLKDILDAARLIKPQIITIVGGGIITSDPETAMKALEKVDYGVIGEGETTICELADAIEGKRDVHSVSGLIFKNDETWTITSKREELLDLDTLIYPDYVGFEFDKVLEKIPTDIYAFGQGRFGFVSFGRSCPFNCTFCFHPSGTKYRKRSINSVFKEIDYLIDKFDIKNIAVTDELFVSRIEDVREFCKKIKERKVGFVISLRVDMINREMLELLKNAGCLSIGFGLESADNRILKSMKKHITVEQIDYALSLCNEVGVNCMGNFIFGDVEETVETATNTINWWKEHPQYMIAMHLIVAYPGSELYKIAFERGIISDKIKFIKEGCPYVNFSKMTDDEYRKIAVQISMLSQVRTEILKDVKFEYIGFGKINLIWRCPQCGSVNSSFGIDVFRTLSNTICDHCSKLINLVAADYVDDIVEENFKLLENHKIGIWPMITSVSEVCNIAPSILKDNVYFIDSAKLKNGVKYNGKTINYPNIIESEKIDTVFVTLTTSVATEIINDLKNNYPTVKNIFFVGDLVDPNFRYSIKD